MRLRSLWISPAAVFVVASLASGQGQPQVPPGVPTTVQLPTFSFFTVQTVVSVPDGGGMSLGGINRGAEGSAVRGFGPLQNRALGSTRGTAGMSVHASIIDHHELDEKALAEAAARRTDQPGGAAVAMSAALSGSAAGRVRDSTPVQSLATIREENTVISAQQAREAAEYLAKGRQAEAEGKPGVAKVYYQMAAKREAGVLKQQALARLAALNAASTPVVARRQ